MKGPPRHGKPKAARSRLSKAPPPPQKSKFRRIAMLTVSAHALLWAVDSYEPVL
jgi:hypothetical protein